MDKMLNLDTKHLENFKISNRDENSTFQNRGKEEIKRFMEILHLSEDIELQVKLLSILAVHVISNNSNKADIITSNSIYDKLRNILSTGSQLKAAKTLNFVSALLYCDREAPATRARSLALHARRMLRASGALTVMADMFTSTMLQQETWKALCCCLAECCRGCLENQSHCSHLVPLCVEKCIKGNLDALITLKSLINNHKYNTQLFFESNGIFIFQREESLQYDETMQLLNIVVQNASRDMLDLLNNVVSQNLERYKELFGVQSKMGQWAIVNLYHINSRRRNTGRHNTNTKMVDNVTKKVKLNDTIGFEFPRADDTTRLIQNVLREIQQFDKVNKSSPYKMPLFSNYEVNLHQEKINRKVPEESMRPDVRNSFKNKPTTCNEMSFSFLLKKKSQETSVQRLEVNKNESSRLSGGSVFKQNTFLFENVPKVISKPQDDLCEKNYSRNNILMESIFAHDESSIVEFKPVLVSTPKHSARNYTVTSSKKSSRLNRSTTKCSRRLNKRKGGNSNHSRQVVNSRSVKQQSISSRLFDAINDSCTTFVKTVTNIFKTKKSHEDDREQETTAGTDDHFDSSCSYSFTNYIRKRNILLSTERPRIDKSMIGNEKNSTLCKSCDDTRSLKRKIISDSQLKETVTKLKMGINLYGCDFRKISRAMWPREKYMTPEVLYNLYRKLIVK